MKIDVPLWASGRVLGASMGSQTTFWKYYTRVSPLIALKHESIQGSLGDRRKYSNRSKIVNLDMKDKEHTGNPNPLKESLGSKIIKQKLVNKIKSK